MQVIILNNIDSFKALYPLQTSKEMGVGGGGWGEGTGRLLIIRQNIQ